MDQERVKESSLSRRVSQLESLVEELLKDNPIEERIQKKMIDLKIQYTSDPIERINRVLAAMHPFEAIDFEGE